MCKELNKKKRNSFQGLILLDNIARCMVLTWTLFISVQLNFLYIASAGSYSHLKAPNIVR